MIEQSLSVGLQSSNKIPLAPNKLPKWARADPVNPSSEQQSTLPKQLRDKQQASGYKLPLADVLHSSLSRDGAATLE